MQKLKDQKRKKIKNIKYHMIKIIKVKSYLTNK